MAWLLKFIDSLMAYLYPMSSTEDLTTVTVPMPPVDPATMVETHAPFIDVPVSPETPSRQEILYKTTAMCLGRDLAPKSPVDDSMKCVVQVQEVIKLAFGSFLGDGEARYNTRALWQVLATVWDEIPEPEYGCVIIAPTGSGNLPHGHVGITLKHGVASNDSTNGRFVENYTAESFIHFFRDIHRFQIHIYRPK
jgi:hypothetical protein